MTASVTASVTGSVTDSVTGSALGSAASAPPSAGSADVAGVESSAAGGSGSLLPWSSKTICSASAEDASVTVGATSSAGASAAGGSA